MEERARAVAAVVARAQPMGRHTATHCRGGRVCVCGGGGGRGYAACWHCAQAQHTFSLRNAPSSVSMMTAPPPRPRTGRLQLRDGDGLPLRPADHGQLRSVLSPLFSPLMSYSLLSSHVLLSALLSCPTLFSLLSSHNLLPPLLSYPRPSSLLLFSLLFSGYLCSPLVVSSLKPVGAATSAAIPIAAC